MTSQGSPYARFRRALDNGNLDLIRLAAKELPRVGLHDALRVCAAMRDAAPLYERAAVRWLGRFALESRADLEAILEAAAALQALPDFPDRSTATLNSLCREHGVVL